MPKGPAARVTDPVLHPLPGILTPGPGSPTVLIGSLPAWRGVPAGAGAAIQAAKSAADATVQAAEAATLAAAGTPGAPAALAAEIATKTAVSASMAGMISGASAGADIHNCLTPVPPPVPHGIGVVVDGSATVLINNLPACRMGDTIIETLGPPNKIVMGLPTVIIGG